MKKVLAMLGLSMALVVPFGGALAQDAGVPDTMYVEVYPGDQFIIEEPGPWFVRFPIYVTHDIVDPAVDSIAGFVIPLCYEVQEFGPVDYCSLSRYWNNSGIISVAPDVDRSIFRHMPDMTTATVRNRMMDLNSNFMNGWDFIFLDLGDEVSQFFLSMVPTGSMDQRWWEGSRVLLATMTFKVSLSDSMWLYIDSCFWPPSSRLAFQNSSAQAYIPKHFLPMCQSVRWRCTCPPEVYCPSDQSPDSAGHFIEFLHAQTHAGTIEDAWCNFYGEGVENVVLTYESGFGTPHYSAFVEYDVVGRCEAGGYVRVEVIDDIGIAGWCRFYIVPFNDPPHFSLPDTTLAIAGSTRGLFVSATDAENDPVSIVFDALWYEPDSLRPPTNIPSYDGGNPGIFAWLPVEGEEGPWICSFSATDSCGAVTVHRVTILVGPLFCGDSAGDEEINVSDVIYLIGYLFTSGPAPSPLCKGDANCDGVIDIGDVVRLLNYLFKYGSAPCFECCAR